MKGLVKYIFEKVLINKDTKVADYSQVKNISLAWPDWKDEQKMIGYRDKGSKPSRLIATIKDNGKLQRRFRAARKIGWQEAVKEFGKALVDRGICTQEELDKFMDSHKY